MKVRKTFLVAAPVAGLLSLTVYLSGPDVLRDGGVRSSPDGVIEVSMERGTFHPATVVVQAGRPVTIRLSSPESRFDFGGLLKHQFAIDELGVDIVAPLGGAASVTFTPVRPGTYVFYCGVCCGGRANPDMSGTFVVEA